MTLPMIPYSAAQGELHIPPNPDQIDGNNLRKFEKILQGRYVKGCL